MKDSWSLKDKGMRGYPNGEPTGIYSREVIETLRRKLIEDYVYLAKHPDWLNKQEMDFIDQINKRFGIDK